MRHFVTRPNALLPTPVREGDEREEEEEEEREKKKINLAWERWAWTPFDKIWPKLWPRRVHWRVRGPCPKLPKQPGSAGDSEKGSTGDICKQSESKQYSRRNNLWEQWTRTGTIRKLRCGDAASCCVQWLQHLSGRLGEDDTARWELTVYTLSFPKASDAKSSVALLSFASAVSQRTVLEIRLLFESSAVNLWCLLVGLHCNDNTLHRKFLNCQTVRRTLKGVCVLFDGFAINGCTKFVNFHTMSQTLEWFCRLPKVAGECEKLLAGAKY